MKNPFEHNLDLNDKTLKLKNTEDFDGLREALKTMGDRELGTTIQNLSYEDTVILDQALNLEGEPWRGFAMLEATEATEALHKLVDLSLTNDILLKNNLAKEIVKILG